MIFKNKSYTIPESKKVAVVNQIKVAAIVPAYNEATRIAQVLTALSQTQVLDEIIVIDDGSTDSTQAVVGRFSNVLLLRNEVNQGKGLAMQRGVDATQADILFFCDADVVGLTPAIVTQIIQPVLTSKTDMFIGISNGVMQKTLNWFIVNSGQRAVRRKIWQSLPQYFKHRYRVELGLNVTAEIYGLGWQAEIFDYYQTVKEKKYGILQGTILRWRMNMNVLSAYLAALFYKVKSQLSKKY